MKKRFFALLALFTFIIFSFISCTYTLEEESYSSMRSIKANVSASDSIFASSSRTIMSSVQDISTLDFYIEGQKLSSASGGNIELQRITVYASDSTGTNGYFNFTFEPQYYRLTLYGVTGGTALSDLYSNIIMQSSVAVDLRASDEIYFYLSSYKVSGSGGYDLALYADGWTPKNTMNITAEIYSKESGACLRSQVLGSFPVSPENPSPNFSSTGNPASYNLPSGTYLFKLTVTDSPGDNDDKTFASYVYSDDLVIFANQIVTEKIPIPDITQKKPASPTYLIAGFADSASEDERYSVEFAWDDNSYNETRFEIELLDITEACKWEQYETRDYIDYKIPSLLADFTLGLPENRSALDSYWQALISHYKAADIHKVPGGSSYAVLKLTYGTNYLARICAVNEAGKSDYAYVDIKNTGNKAFPADIDGKEPQLWKENAAGLSRYKINYELNGGFFYDDDSLEEGAPEDVNASVVGSAFSLVSYQSQLFENSAPISVTLEIPEGIIYSGTKTSSLKYFENSLYYDFEYWANGSESGTKLETYTGYEDITVFGKFKDIASTLSASFVPRTSDLSATDIHKGLCDSDIIVTAHKDGAAELLPFKKDTEEENNPIYLSEDGKFTVSASSYRYLNFLLNKTHSKAESVSYKICQKGGSPKAVSANVETTAYYEYSYDYVQIDLTALDSGGNALYKAGNSYCVFYSIVINNMSYEYTVLFEITD